MSGRAKKFARTALSAAVVVGVFVFALPQIADLSLVWAAIVDMSWLEVTTLLAAAAWNIYTYLLVMVAALPGLSFGQAFLVGQSSTAISTALPAGSAVGIGATYSMYSSLGRSGPEIALATVVTGLWNTFVKLGLPIVALAILALTGAATAAEIGAAFVGLGLLLAALVVFALALRSPALAWRIGSVAEGLASRLRRLLRRAAVTGWGDGAVRFRSETIALLRRRWFLLTAATVISHLSLYLVLLLALRHMDVGEAAVSWVEVLGVFAFVRLATALPITPGGLGVVELVATAGLVLAGGAQAPVVAAVLVYRFLTLIVQVAIGAVCYAYLTWQISRRSRADGDLAGASALRVPRARP